MALLPGQRQVEESSLTFPPVRMGIRPIALLFTQTASNGLIMRTSTAASPLLIQILIKRPSSPSLVPTLASPSISAHKTDISTLETSPHSPPYSKTSSNISPPLFSHLRPLRPPLPFSPAPLQSHPSPPHSLTGPHNTNTISPTSSPTSSPLPPSPPCAVAGHQAGDVAEAVVG